MRVSKPSLFSIYLPADIDIYLSGSVNAVLPRSRGPEQSKMLSLHLFCLQILQGPTYVIPPLEAGYLPMILPGPLTPTALRPAK